MLSHIFNLSTTFFYWDILRKSFVVFILHSWNLCKVIIKYRLLMAWYLVWIILCFAGRHLIIWLPWDSLGQTSNQCTSSYHTWCSKNILFAHISLFSCNVYLYQCNLCWYNCPKTELMLCYGGCKYCKAVDPWLEACNRQIAHLYECYHHLGSYLHTFWDTDETNYRVIIISWNLYHCYAPHRTTRITRFVGQIFWGVIYEIFSIIWWKFIWHNWHIKL